MTTPAMTPVVEVATAVMEEVGRTKVKIITSNNYYYDKWRWQACQYHHLAFLLFFNLSSIIIIVIVMVAITIMSGIVIIISMRQWRRHFKSN